MPRPSLDVLALHAFELVVLGFVYLSGPVASVLRLIWNFLLSFVFGLCSGLVVMSTLMLLYLAVGYPSIEEAYDRWVSDLDMIESLLFGDGVRNHSTTLLSRINAIMNRLAVSMSDCSLALTDSIPAGDNIDQVLSDITKLKAYIHITSDLKKLAQKVVTYFTYVNIPGLAKKEGVMDRILEFHRKLDAMEALIAGVDVSDSGAGLPLPLLYFAVAAHDGSVKPRRRGPGCLLR